MALTKEKNVQVQSLHDRSMFQVAYQGTTQLVISSGSSVASTALGASTNMAWVSTDNGVWVNMACATAAPVANTNGASSFFLPAGAATWIGVTPSGVIAVRALTVANVSIMEAATS